MTLWGPVQATISLAVPQADGPLGSRCHRLTGLVNRCSAGNTAVVSYDVDLADRLREILASEPAVVEKRMFGGLAFMVAGHMAVSATGQGGLLLRIDPAQGDALLADSRASRLVMRGREMAGWLRVDLDGSATDDDLKRWIRHGVGYARSLPPK